MPEGFGYYTENKENVDAFLNGTYMIPPVTDQYAEEFIEALSMPNAIHRKDTITLSVTLKEHKSALKKNKCQQHISLMPLLMSTINFPYLMSPLTFLTIK